MVEVIHNDNEQANLVVYHNNLSDLALKDFNAKERDLLMALCCRLQNCGTQEFSLTFKEIRKMASYSMTSNKTLGEALDSMTDKLMSLKMKAYGENGEITKFVFFPKFKIIPDKGILEVRTGEEFTYLINELGANFTRFELEEHTSLKSAYSKECYRQLMRYRDKGTWWVYADRFRELMNLPDSYRDADIKAKVIPQIESELSRLFESFESNIEYRGGKPYKYTFRFNRFGDLPPREETSNADEPREPETKPAEKRYSPETDERFIAFWEAYPRKVNKQGALKIWGKIRPDEELFAQIMQALEKAKKTVQWTKDKQFIPHPTTWLNGKRWEDEIESVRETREEFERKRMESIERARKRS